MSDETKCPKCGAQVKDPFIGNVTIHDVEHCNGVHPARLQDEIASRDQCIRTQNLLAQEEAKILQRWKQYAIANEEYAKKLLDIAERLLEAGVGRMKIEDWKNLRSELVALKEAQL